MNGQIQQDAEEGRAPGLALNAILTNVNTLVVEPSVVGNRLLVVEGEI